MTTAPVPIAELRRLLNEHRAAVVPWGSPEVQATWEQLEPFLGMIFTTKERADGRSLY